MNTHKNKQGRRVLAAMLMTVMVAASLSGCGGGDAESRIPPGTAENEILTLSPVAQDKELVTRSLWNVESICRLASESASLVYST